MSSKKNLLSQSACTLEGWHCYSFTDLYTGLWKMNKSPPFPEGGVEAISKLSFTWVMSLPLCSSLPFLSPPSLSFSFLCLFLPPLHFLSLPRATFPNLDSFSYTLTSVNLFWTRFWILFFAFQVLLGSASKCCDSNFMKVEEKSWKKSWFQSSCKAVNI